MWGICGSMKEKREENQTTGNPLGVSVKDDKHTCFVDPHHMLRDCSAALTGKLHKSLLATPPAFQWFCRPCPSTGEKSVPLTLSCIGQEKAVLLSAQGSQGGEWVLMSLVTLTPPWKTWISVGSGPNMKMGEPKRGHPSPEQVLFLKS